MNNTDYLAHHGIEGQRWGIRRFQNEDGTLTPEGRERYTHANAYTLSQYKRDKDVYGSRAAKRINKKMLNGGMVSGARTKEAERITSTRNAASTVGKIGSVVGGILGAVGGLALRKIEVSNNQILQNAYEASVITGTAAIGSAIGKYGGRTFTMLSAGYSPRKYRET